MQVPESSRSDGIRLLGEICWKDKKWGSDVGMLETENMGGLHDI